MHASSGTQPLIVRHSALVAGNAVKAGVRFLSYDSIKLAVADKTVRAGRGHTGSSSG